MDNLKNLPIENGEKDVLVKDSKELKTEGIRKVIVQVKSRSEGRTINLEKDEVTNIVNKAKEFLNSSNRNSEFLDSRRRANLKDSGRLLKFLNIFK